MTTILNIIEDANDWVANALERVLPEAEQIDWWHYNVWRPVFLWVIEKRGDYPPKPL